MQAFNSYYNAISADYDSANSILAHLFRAKSS